MAVQISILIPEMPPEAKSPKDKPTLKDFLERAVCAIDAEDVAEIKKIMPTLRKYRNKNSKIRELYTDAMAVVMAGEDEDDAS